MSSSIMDAPSRQHQALQDEIKHTMNEPSGDEALQGDLITPSEAARVMSRIAGYEITSDDIRQLRRRKKIKAAKQTSRMTWYERSEIEKAKPPKKHRQTILEDTIKLTPLDGEKEQRADPREERVLQLEIQKIELEKRRLALEERRLALEERRLALEEKQLQNKRKERVG